MKGVQHFSWALLSLTPNFITHLKYYTMKNTIYLNAKSLIREEANTLKRQNPKDKPYVRECLNILCDDLCKQFNFHAMKETISEKQAKQYSFWLASFTADCHPK